MRTDLLPQRLLLLLVTTLVLIGHCSAAPVDESSVNDMFARWILTRIAHSQVLHAAAAIQNQFESFEKYAKFNFNVFQGVARNLFWRV